MAHLRASFVGKTKWKHKALISMKDLHSDGNKRTIVENSVHDIAEL